MTITARKPGTCRNCGGRIHPGESIEWQRGQPATHTTCPTTPEPTVREELPIPQDRTRAGRMLLAGQLDATVTLTSGEHVTVFARALRMGHDGWERVGLLEPGATVRLAAARRGQRIGWIGEGFTVEWDADVTDDVKRAVRYLFGALPGHSDVREVLPSEDEHGAGLFPTDDLAPWTRITVASACGMCGRDLRRPESIDLGIGPECASKPEAEHYTGKGHAAVHTPARPEFTDDELRVLRSALTAEMEYAGATGPEADLRARIDAYLNR